MPIKAPNLEIVDVTSQTWEDLVLDMLSGTPGPELDPVSPCGCGACASCSCASCALACGSPSCSSCTSCTCNTTC
jgi:hypothetical protein